MQDILSLTIIERHTTLLEIHREDGELITTDRIRIDQNPLQFKMLGIDRTIIISIDNLIREYQQAHAFRISPDTKTILHLVLLQQDSPIEVFILVRLRGKVSIQHVIRCLQRLRYVLAIHKCHKQIVMVKDGTYLPDCITLSVNDVLRLGKIDEHQDLDAQSEDFLTLDVLH